MLIGWLMFTHPDKTPEQLVFGFLLFMSGLTMLAYINRLVIDIDAGILIHQRGLLLPIRSSVYELKKVKAVSISVKVIGKSDDERTIYPVRLSGIRDSVLLKHGNPWYSRVIAEQIAIRIQVPMKNRVYGVTSTRSSDELDTPLLERWARDGKRFSRPSILPNTGLVEAESESTYVLSIRAQYPPLKYLVAVFFILATFAIIDVPFENVFHSKGYRGLAVFLLFFGTLTMAFVGRSNFRVTPVGVSFRQGYFPIRYRLRITDIEEMVVANDGITLISDKTALWVHWGSSKRESDYLEAIVPYQILRLGGRAKYDGN